MSTKAVANSQASHIPSKLSKIAESYQVAYDFSSPTETFVLDKKLNEISSLAYEPEGNYFITNDDESGHFYHLRGDDFTIAEEISFSKKGDYEAIEKIGNKAYVAKSNGNLYVYDYSTTETTTIKSVLSPKNDIEGLCYDKSNEALLLACKGHPYDEEAGSKKKKYKSIYKYDLRSAELDTEPYMNVHIKELTRFVELTNASAAPSKLKKLKHRVKQFAPSGIAVHPVTGEYYVISARGSLIAIYTKTKELVHVELVNNKTIPQPEGITFDIYNNLYISTEGQTFSGKIFKFNVE